MEHDAIEKCRKDLTCRLPILGGRRRWQACQKLGADSSANTVPLLASALDHRDVNVRSIAEFALCSLKNPEAIDALCEIAIRDPDGSASRIVKEEFYQPQSVSRRCVLFLLTGQLSQYFDLDIGFQYLRSEYRAANENLKQQIGEAIRRSEDPRLVGLFRVFRRRKRASEITEKEAAIVIDIHRINNQWQDIFTLLFHIQMSSVVVALDVLKAEGWVPKTKPEAELMKELLEIRSSISMVSKSNTVEEILGPVFSEWIEDGKNGEMKYHPDGVLNLTFTTDAPPAAIAALSALASRGRVTKDIADRARNHKHWSVRMAYFALCDVPVPLLFSDDPVILEPGWEWADGLVSSILDVVAFRSRAAILDPNLLESLQKALKQYQTKSPDRKFCGQLLEALGRYNLRHTIEIDQRMLVTFNETAIEIEG